MMMIGSSVDYVRSGGMRNVSVTKALEHLYATTAKFSGCVILATRPAYSYPNVGVKISSHLEGETGCAFCVIQNNVQIHQWTAKLSPHNTVFQAETSSIKDAINWANSKGISTSIWSDSEMALRAISSFKISNSLVQEAQQALLQNPSMQLNWIKAHVGFFGNEAEANLAKHSIKEGTHLHPQAPKCHLKKVLRNLSLNKWQQDWDSGDTGRELSLIYSLKSLKPKPNGQENTSFSLRAVVLFPAISTDSGFIMREKGVPSPLSNFLSPNVIFSFYQTRCRKYSSLVEKITSKKLSRIK
ncbi:hypothetical protein AVEN_28001-1 [Araneus ventricosus]|uniref:Uncharacterized protein n=1 Tax=Araneus ventricosus TaxID=182803 RepID=A0A4Y2BGM9_ARAVE|nr:hypothetical protein AVEN_28001-1 [Araneus ventricosus]